MLLKGSRNLKPYLDPMRSSDFRSILTQILGVASHSYKFLNYSTFHPNFPIRVMVSDILKLEIKFFYHHLVLIRTLPFPKGIEFLP